MLYVIYDAVKMKIAVLISGEYRTFDICRKTMSFLDDERVTVFFSTWSSSNNSNSVLGYSENRTITKEHILETLGNVQVGGVLIDHMVMLNSGFDYPTDRYNSPMVFRWLRGLEMIYNSGEYDLIIILRPDLFFNKQCPLQLDALEAKDGILHALWATSIHIGRLQDVLFAATPLTMKRVFPSDFLSSWNTAENPDWHTWLYSVVAPKSEIKNIAPVEIAAWARPVIKNPNPTFEEVQLGQLIWRDSVIVKQIEEYGEDFVRGQWGDAATNQAMRKIEEGYFDAFKSMT